MSDPWPSFSSSSGCALEDHLPSVLAGAGPEIDHVVCRANGLLVVLDDDDCVSQIAEARQRGEQLAVVALMQADGRLVEHVEHSREVRAYLSREPDSLPFSAGQRCRTPIQRQVPDADIVEKAEPLADFAQHASGNQLLAVGQLETLEHLERVADRQVDVLGDASAFDSDGEALRLQTPAMTCRTLAQRPVRLEIFLLYPRCVLVSASKVWNDALEVLAEWLRLCVSCAFAVARRARGLDEFLGCLVILVRVCVAHHRRGLRRRTCGTRSAAGRAEQHQVALLFRQLRKWDIGIDAEDARQRQDRLAHELAIAARPRRNGAAEERFRFVRARPDAGRSHTSRQAPGNRDTRRAAS